MKRSIANFLARLRFSQASSDPDRNRPVSLRRFQQEDWYGWAGCSKFPNGSEPWITYRAHVCVQLKSPSSPDTFVAKPSMVILSGEEPGHLEITVNLSDDYYRVWACSGATALNAVVFLHQARFVCYEHDLLALGFSLVHEEAEDGPCEEILDMPAPGSPTPLHRHMLDTLGPDHPANKVIKVPVTVARFNLDETDQDSIRRQHKEAFGQANDVW